MRRFSSETRRMFLLTLIVSTVGCRDASRSPERVEPVESETQRAAPEASAEKLASEPPSQAPKFAPPPTDQPDPRAVYHVPLSGNEPQKGPDDAMFTIVAFSDYQCPFCKNMEPTLEALRDKYPDEVRIVWMQFPLPTHPRSRPAATAALEAQAQKGDRGYWQMHDKIFENQRALSRADLERYAKEMGLDMREFRRALDTDEYAEIIDEQVALGTRLGFRGTPAFYMNGQYIPGLPLPAWESAIRLRRPIYERYLRSGTPKSALYETIIADGKKSL